MIDNERIARWAGFKSYTDPTPGIPIWRIYPNGWMSQMMPDFPNDIKACFDHLEPELYRRGYLYEMCNLLGSGRHRVDISHPDTGSMVSAFDNEPAQAFCEAVEEIIALEEATDETQG